MTGEQMRFLSSVFKIDKQGNFHAAHDMNLFGQHFRGGEFSPKDSPKIKDVLKRLQEHTHLETKSEGGMRKVAGRHNPHQGGRGWVKRALVDAFRRPEEEAALMADLLEARASALGISLQTYLDRRIKGTERRVESKELAKLLKNLPILKPEDVVHSLGEKIPHYLLTVSKFMEKRLRLLLKGRVPPTDVVKAVVATLGSIRSPSRRLSYVEKQMKGTPYWTWLTESHQGATYLARATAREADGSFSIRPEEFVAGWLASPEGRKALLDWEQKGPKYDRTLWKGLGQARSVYGSDTFKSFDFLGEESQGRYNLANLGEFTRRINLLGKSTDPDKFKRIDELSRKVVGIKAGKVGFFGHFLGLSEQGTVDAVEINTFLTGLGDIRGDYSARAALARDLKAMESDKTVGDPFKERVRKALKDVRDHLQTPIPYLSTALVHHWLWDAAKGMVTTHNGLYWTFDNRHPHPTEESTGEKSKEPLNLSKLLPHYDKMRFPAWETRAITRVDQEGKAVLRAFQGASFRDMLRSLWPIFYQDLDKRDRQVVHDHFGIGAAGHPEAAHFDAGARALENYLRHGKHPVPEVQTIFARIRGILQRWYARIKQYAQHSQLGFSLRADKEPYKLHKDIVDVFDRMFARPKIDRTKKPKKNPKLSETGVT